jgi:hypothetical protein
MGGYRLAMIALGIVWLAPLVYVIVRRLFRRKPAPPPPPAKPVTLADQLRPLVEAAIRRDLSTADRARLEMLLLAYWRDRLRIRAKPHADALGELRAHPEAGAILTRIETWFHKPPGESSEPADLAVLLQPYRTASPIAIS